MINYQSEILGENGEGVKLFVERAPARGCCLVAVVQLSWVRYLGTYKVTSRRKGKLRVPQPHLVAQKTRDHVDFATTVSNPTAPTSNYN